MMATSNAGNVLCQESEAWASRRISSGGVLERLESGDKDVRQDQLALSGPSLSSLNRLRMRAAMSSQRAARVK